MTLSGGRMGWLHLTGGLGHSNFKMLMAWGAQNNATNVSGTSSVDKFQNGMGWGGGP